MEEEQDNRSRSTKKVKTIGDSSQRQGLQGKMIYTVKGAAKSSHRHTVMRLNSDIHGRWRSHV